MATSHETRVLPYSPAQNDHSNSGDKVFQLAELGAIEPKLYVHMIEVFSLPADANKDHIVSHLTEGLSRTLAEYPVLTSTLHFDNAARRIAAKQGPSSSVALHVKEPGPGGEIDIEPFSFLEKHDFPVHLLDASKVLPPNVVGVFPVPGQDLSAEGPPVCAFQVTFIQGGAILAVAVTHQVCDGPGCEALLNSWSRNSKAASKGTAGTTAPIVIPERSILRVKGTPVSPEEWEKLGDKFPTFKARDGPPAPPPADFKMPTVKTRVWHVSKSNLQELKTLCSAPLPAGSPYAGHSEISGAGWVSTYDALLALLWRGIVRAKQPLLQAEPTAPSKAIHAVNARKRADPPMPDEYIGVAVTLPQSPSLTVADVLDAPLEAAGPLLARTVRAATSQVTPSYVADLERWALSAHDLRWVELDMHWVLGLDCMAFDWHTMKSYEEHDFGFGTPAALRWPHPQFEGFFFTLPTRTSKGNEDEGFEIMLGLEESCYARFEKDEELLRFAEQRGTGV
ncbi:Trichothecene 3-O-acetyltransferase [Cytospora mali]|uniref:Trichothecene 3-O-acetyltransferase n=1 Tax=Cytospora mali TaxID=578113 RepID=A0A194W392_CYTMA|nr:Trichothecene 3-O-acetyltransferase [Valsa mali]